MKMAGTIRWARRGLELAGALALALIPRPAHAYNITTHNLLTQLAVSNSAIAKDFDLFVRLGFPNVSSRIYYDSEGRGPYTAAELPPLGAVWEDEWYARIALNHFFDPQFNSRVGRGLDLGIVDGVPLVFNASVDWSLEDKGGFPDAQGRHTFSISDAQNYFFAALAAASNGEREAATARMLQSLGHVVHHIQDMAQPQHVRNEWHLEVPDTTASIPIGSKDFENHVARREADIPYIVQREGYPTPTLDTFRSFWHTLGSRPAYTGMAEFTAQNFFSPRTAFTVNRDGSLVIPPDFPLPGSARLVTVDRGKETIRGRAYARVETLLMGQVVDPLRYPTCPCPEVALAGVSTLQTPTQRPLFLQVGTPIWDAQLPYLLPRAVAFSTGIINHFFRGKIAMARSADQKAWVVSNPGAHALYGRVTVYGEDSSGGRAALPGAQFGVSLLPGISSTVTFPEPSGITKLVVVFQGQIGKEGDSSLKTGYVAVTGQVTPFVARTPPPPATCDGPFSYPSRFGAFSSSGVGPEGNYAEYTMEMGESTGSVLYNGYSIIAFQNAGMKIYANNASRTGLGATSFTAFGTGFGPYKVPFNGAVNFSSVGLGTTSVIVRIHSSGPIPTASELAIGVSCPGGSIPDLTSTSVSFGITGNSCRARWTISTDGEPSAIYVDASFSRTMRLGLHKVSANWEAPGLGGCGGSSSTSPGDFFYNDTRGRHSLGTGSQTFLVN